MNKFFSEKQEKAIVEAIRKVEKSTMAEIRVHVLPSFKEKDSVKAARRMFFRLKMHKTKHRNGVLFVLATKDKKFAIFGDKGIDDKVEKDFWDSTKDLMQLYFRTNEFAEGVIEGVELAGEQLALFFPQDAAKNINELSNAVSYGV